MYKKKLKRREEKEENNKIKDPKTKEKRKNRKKLGRMVAPIHNFDPKLYCGKRISEAAMGGAGAGDLIIHSLCGPVERKKHLTWAAQV
jgi:hypothetical protein